MPVPHADLTVGIRNCLANALELVDSADLLLSTEGRVRHVTVLFFHAIEEFGKAVLLKDALDAGTDFAIEAKGRPFYEHRPKVAAARRFLSDECITLRSAAFQANAFQANALDTEDTIAEFEAKLRALYVDWDPVDARWRHRLVVSPLQLRSSIDCVRQVLHEKAIEWVSDRSPGA